MRGQENHPNQLNQNPDLPSVIALNLFLKSLVKKWWLFAIIAIMAAAAGYFYAAHKKIQYKSKLTFALDEGGSGVGGFLNFASQLGISIGDGKDIFEGDNITAILKSRRMLQNVLLSVDTFENKPIKMIEYYLYNIKDQNVQSKKSQIHFPVTLSDSLLSYEQDSVLYQTYLDFTKLINAERPDRKLSIYEVNVTTPNEKFTKDFTQRLVNYTNDFYIEIRTRKAKQTLQVLQQRVSDMKGNLDKSITSKATVQDINLNPAFSEAQIPVQKQQANIQVYGAAYGEMYKNLEVARFQYLNDIPLLQIIDNVNYPMEKIRTGKLKTAVLWAFAGCILLVAIFWIRRILQEPKESKPAVPDSVN